MNNQITFKTKSALLLAIVLWASAFVGIRAGLESYSPGGLAVLRFIIASISMIVIYLRFAKRDYIPLTDKVRLLLVGVFGIGLYNISLNYGETSVPSGIASFIISQSPLITAIFAAIFLSERFSLLSGLGMIISIIGVLLISIGMTHGFHLDKGMLYIFIATFVGAFYSIMQKPFLKKYHAIDVAAYLVWGGALSLTVFIPDLIRDITNATLSATCAIIYLGVFPAAIAFAAWSYALASIPASRAVSFLYFMPIVATLLGWVWLDEVPMLISLIGGLIALCGVWVVNCSYKTSCHPSSLRSSE